MGWSTSIGNAIGEARLRASTYYMSWHSADPGVAGSNELAVANGYIRKVIAFDAFSGKASQNTSAVSQTASGGSIGPATHWGIWSAESGGTFICGGALAASVTVLTGETYTAAAGELDVAID